MTYIHGSSHAPQPQTGVDQGRADLVVPLCEVGAGDIDRAGGKGANLGELVREGFPVPSGFVVTSAAHDRQLASSGLADRIPALLADSADGAAVREHVTSMTVTGELEAAVRDAYRKLGEGEVAVRSTATAEDLPGAAFAGQQETYLGVTGPDALLDAILRCWASLWTQRAISYRDRQGIEPAAARIAVVVQQMVPTASAGVLFTANPVSGALSSCDLSGALALTGTGYNAVARSQLIVAERDDKITVGRMIKVFASTDQANWSPSFYVITHRL